MRLDWILYPLLQCGLTAAGLLLCLQLFVSVKRDLAAAERRRAGDRKAFEALAGELRAAKEAEAIGGPLPQPLTAGRVRLPGTSLNMSLRHQVLRRHRRGETPHQIAAALELPRYEVMLLLKIHGMVGWQP